MEETEKGKVVGLAEIVLDALRQTRQRTLVGVQRARMPTHAAADVSGHAVKRRSSLGIICITTHPQATHLRARESLLPSAVVASHFQYFATSLHATHMHTRCVSLAESAALSQRPNEDKRFHVTKWPEYASSQ